MARRYTDSSFVIQTLAELSSQRDKTIDQVPFSIGPLTAAGLHQRNNAYIVSERENPKDFLFEVENMNFNFREITESTTATANDRVIGVKTTTAEASVTINLPPAATVRTGFVLIVKDTEGGAATYNIVIDASGEETIDGEATFTVSTNYAAINFVTNGSNWFAY